MGVVICLVAFLAGWVVSVHIPALVFVIWGLGLYKIHTVGEGLTQLAMCIPLGSFVAGAFIAFLVTTEYGNVFEMLEWLLLGN